MANPSNITKRVQSTAPYVDSLTSNYIKNTVNTTLEGTNPTSQPVENTSLSTQDYEKLVQAKEQDGEFTSLTDKKTYKVSQQYNNPIKSIENNIGVSYNYASNFSSVQKYNPITTHKDNKQTISITSDATQDNTDYSNVLNYTPYDASLYGEEQSVEDGSITESTTNTEDSGSYVLDAPCIITESRTGTASYTEINEKGFFSSDAPVEIKVLQSIDNFDFTTTQSFESISPRGSQTPMRFYNHNEGRTLTFTAKFHQQEYPLEPLLSIAEKAQYLARPYKHSDYALIPKLVKVQIPGRVFRGYLQSASINYSGDDYRTWNNIDIKSQVGTLGEATGFYGGYESRELNPRDVQYKDSFREDISNETIYYGLGQMSIGFSLLIVEEIVLTTYETQVERQEREAILKAQRNEEYKKTQIELARIDVAQSKSDSDFTSIDDCIYVDENGNVVGYKFIDKNGNEVDTTNGIPCITYNEWLVEQELKKGDPNTLSPVSDFVATKSEKVINDILLLNTPEAQRVFLLKDWLTYNPEPPKESLDHADWEARYDEEKEIVSEIPENQLYLECRKSELFKLSEEGEKDLSFFVESSTNAIKYGDKIEPQTSEYLTLLEKFICDPLNTSEDLHNVLNFYTPANPAIFFCRVNPLSMIPPRIDLYTICLEGMYNLPEVGRYCIPTTSLIKDNSCFYFTVERIRKIFNTTVEKATQYMQVLEKTGYCDKDKNDSTALILTFKKLKDITDFNSFVIDKDTFGNTITPDKSLISLLCNGIRVLRESFYTGFKRSFILKTSNDATLYPNRETAEVYIKSRKNPIYFWYVSKQ